MNVAANVDPALTQEPAEGFVRLALANVAREYPAKLDHTINGPDDVGHHRLHGGPGGATGRADQEGDGGDRDGVMHKAEQRDARSCGGLGDEKGGPTPEPVGHHPRAAGGDDPAESVKCDDETGVRGGVAAIEGEIQRHEGGDEGPEPVDQRADPQPPERSG